MKEEFETCSNLLKQVEPYGLTTEVVVTALKEMKENPELSVEEALKAGIDEWVK